MVHRPSSSAPLESGLSLHPRSGAANGRVQAGGHVAGIKRAGRRGRADAAGGAREPGASRAQPRGRRGGGQREPEHQQQPVSVKSSRAQPEPQSRWPWRWGDRVMKNCETYHFLAMLDLTVSLTSWSTNPLLKDSVSTSCAWVRQVLVNPH